MKKIKVLLLTFALVLLAGCGKSLTNKSTGDTMKISLDVDTSSNYVWSYSIMDSNVIDLKSEEFLTPADDETLDGDAQVLTFKAFNEGESEIILSYMNNDSGKTKYDNKNGFSHEFLSDLLQKDPESEMKVVAIPVTDEQYETAEA